MNNEDTVNYFVIDSKNAFNFTELLSPLTPITSSIEEDKEILIKSESQINTLIAKLLSSSTSNYASTKANKPQTNFDFSTSLSLSYIKRNKGYLNTLTASMNSLLNNPFASNELTLSDEIISSISTALFFSFYRISSMWKQFGIASQLELDSAVTEVRLMNTEVLCSFLNVPEDIEVSSMEIEHFFYEDINKSISFLSNSTDVEAKCSEIKPLQDKKYFYAYKHKNEEKHILPLVLIALLNLFCIIKRIKIAIDDIKAEMVDQWLIVLLNVNTLFPNLLEVNFNVISDKISSLLNSAYIKEIITRQNAYAESITSNSIDLSDNQPNEPPKITTDSKSGIHKSLLKIKHKGWNIFNNIINLPQQGIDLIFKPKPVEKPNLISDELINLEVIKSIEHQLKMTVIISYLIAKWEKVRVLRLLFNDPFDKEIEVILQSEGFPLQSCLFLNHFLFVPKVLQLSIGFNSLDSVSFKAIISAILSMSKLRYLSLQLFSSEDYYSYAKLFKLCRKLSIDTSDLFINQSILELNNLTDDLSHSMTNKLLNGFMVNIEYLFHAIRKLSSTLTDLELALNLPSIAKDDDLYTTVLVKFFLNLFIFIINDRHTLNSVKITAPQLSFNDRKCPVINQFLESIDMNVFNKQKIKRLSIQLRLLSVVNISKLMMRNLRTLFIGDLDPESFKAFTKHYTSKEYVASSKLEQLSVSISVVIFNLKAIKDDFIALYRSYPADLVEFNLYSNITLTKEELTTVFNVINYNSVEKYVFYIQKSQEEAMHDYNYASIMHLYQTSKLLRMKIGLAYKKLHRKSSGSTQLKGPLYALRDFLSEKKIIQFKRKL